MAPKSKVSRAHAPPKDPTYDTRHRIDVHNALTTFVHQQGGEVTFDDLHSRGKDFLHSQLSVTLTPAHVKSIFRAARLQAGRMQREEDYEKEVRERKAALDKYFENFTGTRTQERKERSEKKAVYDEYNKLTTHHHGPLALAQRALSIALDDWGRRATEAAQAEKDAAAAQREHDRKLAQDARDVAAAERLEMKKERERKAAEERERREKEREEGARAVNARLARSVAEKREELFKRKGEEKKVQLDFMIETTKFLRERNREREERKAEKEMSGATLLEDGEDKENQMPL